VIGPLRVVHESQHGDERTFGYLKTLRVPGGAYESASCTRCIKMFFKGSPEQRLESQLWAVRFEALSSALCPCVAPQ